MSFQLPTTTAAPPATGGFNFGLTSTPATAKPPGLSFGFGGGAPAATATPASMPSTGFGMAPPTTTANFNLGSGFGAAPTPATSTATVNPGLGGFGIAGTAATTSAPAFGGFGTPAATAPAASTASIGAPSTTSGGFGGFGTAATAAPPTTSAFGGFALTTAPTSSAPTFGAAPAASTTTASAMPVLSGFVSNAPATTTAAAPAATGLPTLSGFLTTGAPTSTSSTPSTGALVSLTTATKTTNSTATTNVPQMTYNQLEEHINKWTLELEEQEKVFVSQATLINAWDKKLINNNEKILELNEAVQKVKVDQNTLEEELEFIVSQQKELEEGIVTLENQFTKLPQIDAERNQTYSLVENLDTQLKQMSEDLKEIIDNLNEASKGQDSNDPIIQIGKILNAHMSSLNWIETSSANITNKLEDLNKIHESLKRDSERSFRSAYYN